LILSHGVPPPGGVKQGGVGKTSFGLSNVLRPRQHSIGYMGDGFYRSKDPTNSIKVLKGYIQYTEKSKIQ